MSGRPRGGWLARQALPRTFERGVLTRTPPGKPPDTLAVCAPVSVARRSCARYASRLARSLGFQQIRSGPVVTTTFSSTPRPTVARIRINRSTENREIRPARRSHMRLGSMPNRRAALSQVSRAESSRIASASWRFKGQMGSSIPHATSPGGRLRHHDIAPHATPPHQRRRGTTCFSARPGRAFVNSPSATTGVPFTSTQSIPTGY